MISQIQYEKPFWDTKTYVAGVDEVGRGCLAGPVVAAAVVLPLNYTNMAGIHDSKQVSEKKGMNSMVFCKKRLCPSRYNLLHKM